MSFNLLFVRVILVTRTGYLQSPAFLFWSLRHGARDGFGPSPLSTDRTSCFMFFIYLDFCLFVHFQLFFQAQAAKVEKTKVKNIMKKERKTVRTIIKVQSQRIMIHYKFFAIGWVTIMCILYFQNYEYFVEDEESRIREMEVMDRLLEVISLERWLSN